MASHPTNADVTLLRFSRKLQGRSVNNGRASMQITYHSVVSVVLVAMTAPNADMSLIRLPARLQSHSVKKIGTTKSHRADNSLQFCQRAIGGQSSSQRRNVADSVRTKTKKPFGKKITHYKSQHADNSLQICQRVVGSQGRSQRRYVADFVAIKTRKPSCK